METLTQRRTGLPPDAVGGLDWVVPDEWVLSPDADRKTIYRVGDDGVLHLDFHEGQQRAWLSNARFVLMLAGKQGGKTAFGPWWLHREFQWHGAGDYLAVTTTFDLFKMKMLPELRTVFEEILGIARWWPGDRILELCDPSGRFWARRSTDKMYARIILRSVVSGSGLAAATANAAWLDEPGQDEWDILDWEEIQARVSLAQGRILGTSTIYNEGYIKSEWHDHAKNGDPDYDVIQYESRVNPQFSEEEFARLKSKMATWRFLMAFGGQFAKPAGLIYHMFDDQAMCFDYVDDQFHYWIPRAVGVDFGGANTASLLAAVDDEGIVWVYDEKMDGGKASSDYAADVLDRLLSDGHAPRTLTAVGGSKSEGQQRRDWGKGGLALAEPGIWDVEGGIDNVIEFIKTGRLMIARERCAGLLHEIATYKRKTLPDGTVTNEIENKKKFHRLDALRYLLSIYGENKGSKTAGAWGR